MSLMISDDGTLHASAQHLLENFVRLAAAERHQRLESWAPSQERRGLCQEPDTTSASNAQKVEDGTSSVFGPKRTYIPLER
jgi:hypothetical protein